MPRLARVLKLFLLFTVAVLPAFAIPRPHIHGNPRDQILLLEQQWRQAQLTDDIGTMEKLLSDNFIGITVTGKVVTKPQQLDRMRQHQLSISRFEASDVKVKLIAGGKVAIVNALADVAGQSETHKIDGSFRYTRVYQRLPSGSWKITSFEATRVTKNEAAAENAKAQ